MPSSIGSTPSIAAAAPPPPPPLDYRSLSKTQLYFSFSLVTSLFFLWGLSYGLLDVLNSHFLTIFGLTKTQSTLLQFAYFIAYLVVAPPMGMFMRRYGYKRGIHVGLTLFSIGAVMFWPSAVFHKYGMFVAFTFLSASGLATLEVAASSFIGILGPPEYAAFRLTLAQAFNGIATVIGPLLASNLFFKGENANSLGTVQYVYLAVAVLGLIINIGVGFAKLPEVQQVVVIPAGKEAEVVTLRGFFRKYHTIAGFFAEFGYVGAQVAVASFTIFYLTEQPGLDKPIDKALASNLFSACQAVFTVGRFLGVWYLRYISPEFSLFVNGLGLIVTSILTATIPGKGGIVCLFLIFFFESTCYPVVFSIATADLGSYAKLGAGVIAAGVSGGAAWPSMQGALADSVNTHISFLIPLIGFIPLCLYGLGMWVTRCQKYNGGLTIWKMAAPIEQTAVEEALGPSSSLVADSVEEEKKGEVVYKE